ncbi:MAG TPA: hypothetical protein VIM61_00100 [Chthoniobacterales bacterium]
MIRSFLLFAVFLLVVSATFAQEETPAPTAESDPAVSEETSSTGSAHLRVWVMVPPEVMPAIPGDQPSLRDKLSLVYDGPDGKPAFLLSAAVPFDTTGYMEVPGHPTEIRLVRQIDGDLAEVARSKAKLKTGAYLTAVIQKENGRYTLSFIDDTLPPPPQPAPGEAPPPPQKRIVFYDFISGDSTTISCKDPVFSKTLTFGTPQILADLPEKIFSISMPIKSAKRTYMGTIEIDLQTNDSLSFLIVKDFFGRTTAKVFPNSKLD